MSSRDADVFAALASCFASLGVRWYVFGAQAAIVHGAVRFTEDIDVTVDPGELSTRDIAAALGAHGFALRIDDDDFVARTRVLPILHEVSGVPLDVVLAGPGIEELFFDGASLVTIGATEVPVARAEDVVAMKVLAGRPKDLEDCVAILAAQGERFDVGRAQMLLELL